MALDSYSNLKQAIADHLERDNDSVIDDFLDIAEARHKREIRLREMIQRSQATLDGRFLALPARFLQMQTLRLVTDPVSVLTEVNLHELNRVRKDGTEEPAFFAIHEEIEFDVTPDDSYTAEMIYYAAFESLSSSNTTNGLLNRAPDVYLYAALVAGSPYYADDERAQLWESMYQQARDGLIRSDRASRHSGPLVSRVVGATP